MEQLSACVLTLSESDHSESEWLSITESGTISGKICDVAEKVTKYHDEIALSNNFSTAIYELIWCNISWEHVTMSAAHFLEALKLEWTEETRLMLAEALYTVWVELGVSDDSKCKQMKVQFLRMLSQFRKNILTDEVAMKILPEDLLGQSGCVFDEKTFVKQRSRMRTNMFWKQTKFNMPHESSEGFAKLVTELFDQTTPADELKKRVDTLIGAFDLDPNRVVDLLLDAFEKRGAKSHLALLTGFAPSARSTILGRKFSQGAPRESLFRCAAQLLKSSAVELEGLYPHLSPPDADLVSSWSEYCREQRREAATFKLPNVQDGPLINMPQRKTAYPTEGDQQKFLLLDALLEIGDWKTASLVFQRLKGVSPASRKSTCSALCSLVSTLISPVYEVIPGRFRPKTGSQSSGEGASKKELASKDMLSVLGKLGPILHHLSLYLYRDTHLFARLCRVMAHFLSEGNRRSAETNRKIRPQVEHIIRECLLPTFSMLPSNSGLSDEFWALLGRFPFQTRYALYGWWMNEIYKQYPELAFQKQLILKVTMRYHKQLLSGDGAGRSLARKLVRFVHCNPLVVMQNIISRVQHKGFDVHIQTLIDSFRYTTALTLDTVCFALLDLLTDQRRGRFNPDGVTVARWMNVLARFMGSFFKKYPTADTTGALEFISRMLEDGESTELIVLSEMISQASGIEAIDAEKIQDAHIKAMGGGTHLKSVVISNEFLLPEHTDVVRACKSSSIPASCCAAFSELSELLIRRLVQPTFPSSAIHRIGSLLSV
eukprot:116295_1